MFEDVDEIVFPIWSEENGQDDLVWYPTKRCTWTLPCAFRLKNKEDCTWTFPTALSGSKTQGKRAISPTCLSEKPRGTTKRAIPHYLSSGKAKPKLTPLATHPGNTYPIGECTWGAKELAPWAQTGGEMVACGQLVHALLDSGQETPRGRCHRLLGQWGRIWSCRLGYGCRT